MCWWRQLRENGSEDGTWKWNAYITTEAFSEQRPVLAGSSSSGPCFRCLWWVHDSGNASRYSRERWLACRAQVF